MNQTEATALLQKYKAGTCSEEEKAALESWYLQWNNEELAFEEAELLNLKKEMWHAMPSKPSAPKTPSLWPKIAVAAAVLIAVSTGLWFYTAQQPEHGIRKELLANDIAPGKNTATLTLASGEKINLSATKTGVTINGGKLAYNDGTNISASSGTQAVIAATPKGGTYQITLSDGSKVWLNAASSIKFPSAFDKQGSRKVSLTGEAYFEVAKDKTRSFIVTTDKQEVTVLGTHFNINSYTEEPVQKTTLLEGAVKVSAFNASYLLSPGQQADLKNNRVFVENADIGQTMAWKNGRFVFTGEDLESIMRKISRWYDVEVDFQDNTQKISFIGVISRNKNISSVLQLIEDTGNVHFKIEGRRITVMK